MSNSKLLGTGLSVALLLIVSTLAHAARANGTPPPPTNSGSSHGGNKGGGSGGTQSARPFFVNGTISAIAAGTTAGTDTITVTPAPRPTPPGGTTTTPTPVVITVSSTTAITGYQQITLANITAGELNIGDRIEVSGVPSGITATSLFSNQSQAATTTGTGGTTPSAKPQDAAPTNGSGPESALGTVHLVGTIAALPTQAAPNTLLLTVGENTIPVTLTATTTLTLVTTLTLANLTSSDVGDGISAFGTTAGDGSLPASQVTITPPPPAATTTTTDDY